MTNSTAAARRPSDKGPNFRGQLGRFRLNPTVSSAQTSPSSQSQSQSQLQLNNGQPTPVVPQRTEPSGGSISSTSSATRRRQSSASNSPETIAAGGDRDGHVSKSKRVSTACEFCRKRKKKCDFQYPNCSACTRAGVVCTVTTLGQSVAHQPVPRDQIENLEKRVEWLEGLLKTQANVNVTGKPTGFTVDDHQVEPPEAEPWFNVPLMLTQPRAGIGLMAADESTETANSSNGSTALASLDGGQLPNIAEIFRDKLENRRSIVPRPVSSGIPPVRRLSSWEEAEQLASKYFEGIGTQYPFIHKAEFMRGMSAIYQNKPVPPDVQNSYHITMAVALLTTNHDIQQATAFYRIARETLTPTLQNEDRVSLQALLSMALYSCSSPAGPSIWQVLGTAMRLATSLGLHKARPISTSTKNIVDYEMDKRTFWSLYNLDRLISVTLSRPLGISDDDITVEIPIEYDDNWVEAPSNCQMSISVQVVKIRRIYSRIYRCFYNPHAKQTGNVAPIIEGFAQELHDWRVSSPVIQTCRHYSTAYYDFLYYGALLVLYRPSVLNPHPDSSCIIGCGDASILIIQSFWDNYSANKIKWLWITLCHIYTAGITMLWCLEQDIRAIRQGMSPLWGNPRVYSSLESVHTLIDEFCAKRKGADRLAVQFKTQSQEVIRRMAEANAAAELQRQQQQMESVQQHLQQPIFIPAAVDPSVMVHPMFYSYGWAGQEIASFYGV